jgi:hypothetical protein
MKKTRFTVALTIVAFIALLSVSCEVDNYPAPDATIAGRIIDNTTGAGIVGEQAGGRIQCYELSWSENPAVFNIPMKSDGSYQNTKMFAGRYRLEANDGAFVVPDPKEVTVTAGSSTTADFTVTPYLAFTDASAVKEGADAVKLTFKLTQHVADATFHECRIFATERSPLAGNTVNEAGAVITDFAADKLGTTFSYTYRKSDLFVSGKTYWFRLGARCTQTPSGRFNMSQIFQIKF